MMSFSYPFGVCIQKTFSSRLDQKNNSEDDANDATDPILGRRLLENGQSGALTFFTSSQISENKSGSLVL